jgi:hypothetical protein
MAAGKFAFGQFWGICVDKCFCVYIRNSDIIIYTAVGLAQYGDRVIRYGGYKQGHVTENHMLILLGQFF